jgi:hypothetical protein
MTPSQQCKQAGLNSLAEVSSLTGVSVQTLINWHRDKPKLFEVVINGCVFIIVNTINTK